MTAATSTKYSCLLADGRRFWTRDIDSTGNYREIRRTPAGSDRSALLAYALWDSDLLMWVVTPSDVGRGVFDVSTLQDAFNQLKVWDR